jgi:hypothetical protein
MWLSGDLRCGGCCIDLGSAEKSEAVVVSWWGGAVRDLNQVLIAEDLPEVPEMYDVTSLPVNALDPLRVRPLTTAAFQGM